MILVGASIPWFACSAILDPLTLNKLITGAEFNTKVQVLYTSIDRPELAFRVGVIPKNTRRLFTALRLSFDPPSSPEPAQTPIDPATIDKTVIFFDSENELYSALDAIIDYLMRKERFKYTKQQCHSIIGTYTSNTHEKDKSILMSTFQKPESTIRVVLASEALGMGVDLSDIRRTVLYGPPKNLLPATLLQRGGRACRDGKNGEIILLVDS